MPFPASIANIGLPRNPTPEMLAAIRAEKMRQIQAMNARQHQQDMRVADYVETHPQAVDDAKRYVARFLASDRHQRYHWVLQQWKELLETKTPAELAAILRDTSEATEELRSSPPVCGEAFANWTSSRNPHVSPKAVLSFSMTVLLFALCLPSFAQQQHDPFAPPPKEIAFDEKVIREGWEQDRKEAQAAHAKVFKEPLMAKIATGTPTIRFVCIRTFHRPFCIRVFRDSSGPKMRVVRFAGKGGYEWGNTDLDETKRLTDEEWQKVLQAAKAPDVHSPLRDMKPSDDWHFGGLDGSTWFVETNLQSKPTFARVWTPTAFVGKDAAYEKPASVNLQPLCDFGMLLIKLAGLPINDPEDRIY